MYGASVYPAPISLDWSQARPGRAGSAWVWTGTVPDEQALNHPTRTTADSGNGLKRSVVHSALSQVSLCLLTFTPELFSGYHGGITEGWLQPQTAQHSIQRVDQPFTVGSHCKLRDKQLANCAHNFILIHEQQICRARAKLIWNWPPPFKSSQFSPLRLLIARQLNLMSQKPSMGYEPIAEVS